MTKSEAEKRIAKLRRVINRHSYLCHVLDKPEISDAALGLFETRIGQAGRTMSRFFVSIFSNLETGFPFLFYLFFSLLTTIFSLL